MGIILRSYHRDRAQPWEMSHGRLHLRSDEGAICSAMFGLRMCPLAGYGRDVVGPIQGYTHQVRSHVRSGEPLRRPGVPFSLPEVTWHILQWSVDKASRRQRAPEYASLRQTQPKSTKRTHQLPHIRVITWRKQRPKDRSGSVWYNTGRYSAHTTEYNTGMS